MRPSANQSLSHADRGRVGAIQGGRIIAAAGFAYVLAWLIGLAIGFATSGPGPSDSPQTIGAYFAAHRQIAMIQAYLLDGIAGISLIVFAGSLRAAVRRWENTSTWSDVLFGAGIAAGTVSLIQGLFTQVLADHVSATESAPTIQALYDLNTEGDTYKLLAVGVFMAAAAVIGLQTHALPRRIAILGGILAPLLAVSGWNFAWSAQAQYLAYALLLLGILVWVAGVSVWAWRREGRAEPSQASIHRQAA